MMSGRSTLGTLARYVLSNAALPASALVTSPILARELLPAGRGEVAVVLAMFTLGSLLVTIGLPWVASLSAGESSISARYASTLAWLGLGASILGGIVLWTLAPLLLAKVPDSVPLLRVCAVSLPIFQAINIWRGAALGARLYGAINAERVTNAIARIVLIGGLALSSHLTVQSAILSMVVGPMIGGVLMITLTVRPLASRVRSHSSTPRSIASTLNSGSKSLWAEGSGALNSRLDQSIMPSLTTTTQIGLYSVAVTLAELPAQVIDAVKAVAFAEGNARGKIALIAQACRCLIALLVAVLAVFCPAVAMLIGPFFGPEFADSVPMFFILSLGAIPLAIGSVLGGGLVILGKQHWQAVGSTLGLLLSLPVLLALTTNVGAMGAALASVISYSVMAVTVTYIFTKQGRVTVRECLVVTRADLKTVAHRAPGIKGRVREPQ